MFFFFSQLWSAALLQAKLKSKAFPNLDLLTQGFWREVKYLKKNTGF